ncbi:lantibiotic dehydratase [Micromonospora sp. WMMA1363]|uniref:lantibiotic dehydratase n=1 Tax=Micromonospora sp. WMMA1363 TaxID=3053985 RepID=UPI00259D0EA6|nr:lantibiotic dehydratase [Micromonospora sp. WMMA1363]MDM4719452.1 lantibiotic dehydratase [Micromonospora sp. WMMA1363]
MTTPTDAAPVAPRWELLPTLVLRSAGFPWQLVESLAYERTRALLAELFTLEQRAVEVAARLRPAARLTRGQQSKLRNLRPLPPSEAFGDDWLAAWNDVTEQVTRAREQLPPTVEADAARVDAALTELRTDPRINDAIVCSSPAVHRDLARGATGGRIRRQLAAYAQRLAAKSETMSFFGPINYARVDVDADAPTMLSWSGHQAIRVRRAHCAARVNDAVQALVLGDDALAARLVPVRKTRSGPPRGADPAAALIRAADGERTVAEIASAVGSEVTRTLAVFRAAVAKGVLTHTWCPPATTVDPLRWTLDRIDVSDAETASRAATVRSLLVKVLDLLDDYPRAPADRKLVIQTEVEALLPAGSGPAHHSRFYNDRVIIHEAAVGTAQLELRGHLARDLSDAVAPVLDLLAHEAELTRVRTNREVAARLGAGRIPLVQALRACADLSVEPAGRLGTELARIVARQGKDVADLDVAGLLSAVPPPAAPVLCSIDVLVGAANLADYSRETTPLVLGDIHDAALLTPWALQFHPDAAGLLAARDASVRRALGDQIAVNVISRRTTGLPPLEFPGVVLELGGTAAAGRRRIGLDQLWLDSDGDRVVLRGDPFPGQSLLFHNGELDTAVHTALALPRIRRLALPDLPHVPRLRWGNAVFSRRRWILPSVEVRAASAGQREADLLLGAARLVRERGLPDRFFAKSPAERKPVYVDTASPDLLKGLARLAGTDERLTVSEALPAPTDAWLRDGELRFASELRCVYLRGGGRR